MPTARPAIARVIARLDAPDRLAELRRLVREHRNRLVVVETSYRRDPTDTEDHVGRIVDVVRSPGAACYDGLLIRDSGGHVALSAAQIVRVRDLEDNGATLAGPPAA